jgi:hypothetical protein
MLVKDQIDRFIASLSSRQRRALARCARRGRQSTLVSVSAILFASLLGCLLGGFAAEYMNLVAILVAWSVFLGTLLAVVHWRQSRAMRVFLKHKVS